MHWFDVATGMALLLGGIWSLFRGFIREVFSILGITAAFVLSFQGYAAVAQRLETVIAHAWLRQAAGFGLIFLTMTLLYVIIAALLHRLITAAGLSVPNRLLGGLLGLVKVTVVIAALCIITAQFFPALAAQLAAESRLAPTFFRVADALTTFLPSRSVEQFQGVSERLHQQLPAWVPVPPSPQSAPRPPGAGQDGISDEDRRALEKLLQKRLESR